MERLDLPYLLVGIAAAANRRATKAVAMGVDVVDVASRPAGLVWRSPLGAPLRGGVDAVSSRLVRDGRASVTQARLSTRVASVDIVNRLGDRLVRSGLADEMADRIVASGALDRLVAGVINHPATEALLAGALDDPGMDRLITRVMESRLVDELIAQLLASEELQLIIDYISNSPELRAVVAQQTAGLAGDVAVGLRTRTVAADALAERLVRSLIRRPRRPEAP